MRRIKWTTKGRNIWSCKRFNVAGDFETEVLIVYVRNRVTGFEMSLLRKFSGDIEWDFYQQEQEMRAEIEARHDFVSTERIEI